jgi:nitroreductase
MRFVGVPLLKCRSGSQVVDIRRGVYPVCMDVLKTIETRRSVRKYKPISVPESALKKILDAGRVAPSAGNKQPWGFVVVRDVERKKKLAEAARNQMWTADAGAFLAVFSDPTFSPGGYGKWNERDPMIAVENMILAAWSLGYGTCWIGAFEEERVKLLLGIPDDKRVICLLPMGVPAETPDPKPRRAFNEVFHAETYGKPLEF